jgi:hypothetical protein
MARTMKLKVPYSGAYVQQIVNELAAIGDVRAPRFSWTGRVKLANYFALSHRLKMNPRFANHLSEEEFRAVLAHEVGHARQRVLTLLSALLNMVLNPVSLLLFWGIHPYRLKFIAVLGLCVAANYAIRPLVTLLKELAADRFCVQALEEGDSLRSVLDKLAGSRNNPGRTVRTRMTQLEKLPSARGVRQP